jgi:N utilization substance protein A
MKGEILDALSQIAREKNIPFEKVLEFLETALVSAYRKDYLSPTSQARIEVRIDPKTGEPAVFRTRTVVKEVQNEDLEISLEEALQYSPDVAEGDEIKIEVTPEGFGRIAAQSAKQVIAQKLREAERDLIYTEFSSKLHDIVSGTVRRFEGKGIFLDVGRAEAYLPPSEQVSRDHLRVDQRVKVYVLEVRRSTKGPQILVSRTHPDFLKRLFELEVPEIASKIVELKAIAREPGYRSKVAVWSRDPRVDPVGACLGLRSQRIQAIMDELRGEKIDIIPWSDDPAQFIAKALSPARVSKVIIGEDRTALALVPDQQLSLAIGKEGQNAKLAVRLTGWRIDIKSESQSQVNVSR